MTTTDHWRLVYLVLAASVLATTLEAQTIEWPEEHSAEHVELSWLPLGDWLLAGEVEEMRWDLDVGDAELRMDQRLVLPFRARVRTRDLEPEEVEHELTMWSWFTDPQEQLLAYSGPVRYSLDPESPQNAEISFSMRPEVTPGEYILWILLYDQTSGLRNLTREPVEIDEIDDDPFPDAFAHVPRVGFPEPGTVTGDLLMPIESARPLDLELIAVLSMPEHRSSEGAQIRHIGNVGDALVSLSQLDPRRGTISVSGLDLIRRVVVFDQPDTRKLDLDGLIDAFENANPPVISLDALAGRHLNGAFFREYVEGHVAGRTVEGNEITRRDVPLKVLIFVTGFSQFADGADKSDVRVEGRCDCRVYHVRIRQNIRDLFDDVNGILDPLSPRTFNLLSPNDLRNAMGRIVEDLERF